MLVWSLANLSVRASLSASVKWGLIISHRVIIIKHSRFWEVFRNHIANAVNVE